MSHFKSYNENILFMKTHILTFKYMYRQSKYCAYNLSKSRLDSYSVLVDSVAT